MFLQRFKKVLPTGLALFSTIFGAGNLIFPLLTGQLVGGSYILGTLGFMLPSVVMCVLGYMGIMACKGDPKEYFSELPRWMYWFMVTVILCVMGPFYIIPRSVLTALGGVKEVYPQIHAAYFSFFFCAVSFLMAIKEDQVMDILGKYITPLKLGGILSVIFGALYFLPHDQLSHTTAFFAITEGIQDGYQPMDLLGTIFFSGMIYRFLTEGLKKENIQDPNELQKRTALVGMIGFVCVGFVYLLLLFVGAKYSAQVMGVEKALILPRITSIALGKPAAIMIAFVLFFSTLATAVAFFSIFTNFLVKDILKNKISPLVGLLVTFGISYGMSLIGLDAIINFIGTYILSWLYPCIMLFVVFKYVKTRTTLKAL